MDPQEKARENRLRNAARRQHKLLCRSRLRDRWAPDYGRYVLISDVMTGARHQAAVAAAFRRGEGMTLDEVEETLHPKDGES